MEYLTKSDVEKMLRIAAKKSIRDHLILLLSFKHALRRSEVAALSVGDVSDGIIRVARRKGSLYTEQTLKSSPDPVFDEVAVLASWLEISSCLKERPHQPSDPLFGISGDWVNRITTQYMLDAGIRRELSHHHSLKHACCAILVRDGVGVEYVQQVAGHKDVKNTIHYLHISGAEAMDKAEKVFSTMGESK